MKPRLPSTVIVGQHTYRMMLKPSRVMGNNLGDCRFDELEIWFRRGMKREKQQEIVGHEILHSCGYPHFDEGEKFTDEKFIETVAGPLVKVLRDNPRLVAYLCS